MKTVKFLMPHTIGALYNEGEIAGFEDDVADDLIERKIAEAAKAKSIGNQKPAVDATRTEPEALSDDAIAKRVKEKNIKAAEVSDIAAKIDAIPKARK